jgi:hypothetical protein
MQQLMNRFPSDWASNDCILDSRKTMSPGWLFHFCWIDSRDSFELPPFVVIACVVPKRCLCYPPFGPNPARTSTGARFPIPKGDLSASISSRLAPTFQRCSGRCLNHLPLDRDRTDHLLSTLSLSLWPSASRFSNGPSLLESLFECDHQDQRFRDATTWLNGPRTGKSRLSRERASLVHKYIIVTSHPRPRFLLDQGPLGL